MIRARRLFSINGLFVRFTVDGVFVLLVSWAVTGDGDVDDVDGEIGPKFTVELVLLAVDDVFNVESVESIINHHAHTHKKKKNQKKKIRNVKINS